MSIDVMEQVLGRKRAYWFHCLEYQSVLWTYYDTFVSQTPNVKYVGLDHWFYFNLYFVRYRWLFNGALFCVGY